MKTIVKQLSKTKVEVTISLDETELKDARQVALAKLAKKIKVPGFRKGHVPIKVAEKHVDLQTLIDDTLENAISKAVAESFINEQIRALERPAVEIKKFVPDSVLEFTAEAEVLPEIKLGNYKKLKAKKEKITVEDSEIDEIVDRMRSGFSDTKEVKRAAKEKDEVIIDFVGKKGDTPFDGGTANDYKLVLGSSTFIPGFEEGIIGKKTGETFDINISFPEDYHVADLKGEAVIFTTTLKKVNEVVLPKVDDEFAGKVGDFKTAAELRADIEREIKLHKEQESLDKLKDDLVRQLVEASDVPVPEVLINDQVESIKQDMNQNFVYRGVTLEQYLEVRGFESEEEWIEKEVKDAAIQRVKSGLVLAELTKVENIEVSEEEIDERMSQYKDIYKNNKQAAKGFSAPESMGAMENMIFTEKAVGLLVELNVK